MWTLTGVARDEGRGGGQRGRDGTGGGGREEGDCHNAFLPWVIINLPSLNKKKRSISMRKIRTGMAWRSSGMGIYGVRIQVLRYRNPAKTAEIRPCI